MKIAAVILAGGAGERLGGVNKAFLELGGIRFIDRAIRIAAECSPVFVATGRQAFEVPPGARSILDLETDYRGPLAGIAAALDALTHSDCDALLSLAVDTPLFPGDFVERALPLLSSAPGVVAAFAGQVYPTNGLWRVKAISGLPDDTRKGTAPRSLKRLAEGVGAVKLDYASVSESDPFRNANTPEDLAMLRCAIES